MKSIMNKLTYIIFITASMNSFSMMTEARNFLTREHMNQQHQTDINTQQRVHEREKLLLRQHAQGRNSLTNPQYFSDNIKTRNLINQLRTDYGIKYNPQTTPFKDVHKTFNQALKVKQEDEKTMLQSQHQAEQQLFEAQEKMEQSYSTDSNLSISSKPGLTDSDSDSFQ